MSQTEYLDRLLEFYDVMIDVPEVVPLSAYHDGWAGAAGAEISDQPYMPHPHQWDYTLAWCRLRAWGSAVDAQKSNPAMYARPDLGEWQRMPVEEIPGWVIRRALPHVGEQWGY